MMNIHLVLPGEVTFGEAEVMNGIKQIGFANTISTANTNNALVKLKLLLKIIFELEQ